MPLPTYGFDPTEVAIPWQFLTQQQVRVVFATPKGQVAQGDRRLLTGKGFGPFKKWLMAAPSAIAAYETMVQSDGFQHPIPYQQINSADFQGLLLPGGHDPGMRSYLGSGILQQKVAAFFKAAKPIGAICHGTIVAARSQNAETGQSNLADYNTTALLATQELAAYALTGLWLGRYYRTYPELVQTEVMTALHSPKQFHAGPLPLDRDTATNFKPAFVVQDRQYVSARWPGDAHLFARTFYDIYLRAQPKSATKSKPHKFGNHHPLTNLPKPPILTNKLADY
ncbi:type 1 glutamine amidotransferase domain-containing protein [Agrilactobacillus composti]|nr:type 1 glutamine amidotransferase domain-containing protein [Agrilactobacillus composti]